MPDVQAGSTKGHHSLELAADENFLALAEVSCDLVCTATMDGQIRFLNRAGRQWLGLSDNWMAKSASFAEFLQSDDQGLAATLLSSVVTSGHDQHSELRFRHQQTAAPIPLSCHLFRLKRHNPADTLTAAIVGRQLYGAQQDIEPLATTNGASLTRLTEMFAGVVSHDLRNPLNAILTCAHLVALRTIDADVKEAVGRIVSSGHRMQRMIDQLLDLTRIRAGGIPLHVGPNDIAAIAHQQVQELSAVKQDAAIELEIRGDASVACDPDRVAQLISNLAGNAIQHGVPGRQIRIAVDGTSPEEVTISIHNDGAIPAEFLPLLFNPFRIVQQKRLQSRGLGLGLFVSRQIAHAHRGDINVTSSSDAGTTFVVRLPRDRSDAQTPAASYGLGDDDLAALEILATAPPATSVTAQLFGAVALHERAPQEYWRLFERYARLLDVALEDQAFKGGGERLSQELRAIAEQLGFLGAGAREVAELHARALKQKTRLVNLAKAQAFTAEGRLVSFELMGHLLSFYRRRSGLAAGGS
jgi:signal transduction histidine kinase